MYAIEAIAQGPHKLFAKDGLSSVCVAALAVVGAFVGFPAKSIIKYMQLVLKSVSLAIRYCIDKYEST